MRLSSIAIALAVALAACASSPQTSAEDGVNEVVGRFIRGLETFDADVIADAFDKDAVLFMPWGHVQRLDGQDAIRANFHAEFDDLRAEGESQTIVPRRRKVQVFGDTAVLTFELGSETPKAGESLGRRTLVLRRFADGWRIVHLHASIEVIETAP